MKTEFVDVNETRKNLRVEIPSDVVDARDRARRARLLAQGADSRASGPGKAPARVIKQRFKDQILHDVAHDLIPRGGRRGAARARRRAGRHAGHPRRDRRGRPAADVHGVVRHGAGVRAGRLRDDLAAPAVEPRSTTQAVDQALQRLRERAARFEPVEGRGVVDGDTRRARSRARREPDGTTETSRRTSAVELGAKANPPGFDEQLLGLEVGRDQDASPSTIRPTTRLGSWRTRDVSYTVTVKGIKRRVAPGARRRVREGPGRVRDARGAARAGARGSRARGAARGRARACARELMKQLAARVPFEVPASLVEREIDRRLEEFARRLMDQSVDPRQAGIDWQRVPREPARGGARSGGERARARRGGAARAARGRPRTEVEQEIARYAERTGRTPAAVRAALEKEGGLSRVYAGLRREKSIDFVMARATIAGE